MNTRPHCALTHDQEHGAALVEFALLAPLFLLLIFSAIEVGLMLFTQMTMQYALREGVRYAVVNHGVTGASPDFNLVVQTIRDGSMGFYDSLNPVYEVSIDGHKTTYTNPAAFGSGMFGARGAVVRVQLNLSWPLVTPLVQTALGMHDYHFSVATTMQNEKS